MNTKQIGFVIIGICVLLFFVMISFIDDLKQVYRGQCSCIGGTCPMESSLPVQGYVGFSLLLALGGTGLTLVLMGRKSEKVRVEKSEKFRKVIKTLKKDERKLYGMIKDSDGVIFQSDLVEKSGFSKVKVSRTLDRLEGKGLVERRRRGMTNVVVLKHS